MCRLFVLFGLCLSQFGALAQYDSAFLLPYPERQAQLAAICNSPAIATSDTALQSYTRLRRLADAHNDPKAAFLARLFTYYHMLSRSGTTLSYVQPEKEKLLPEAEALGVPSFQIGVLAAYADYCVAHQYYEKGFYARFQAYDIYKELPLSEFPEKAYTIYTLAEDYYRFGDYPHAVYYGVTAVRTYPNDYLIAYLGNNLIGMALLRQGITLQARYFFARTYMAATHRPPPEVSGWRGIALGNTALCLEQEGDTARAMRLYRMAIDSTVASKYWDNTAIFAIRLADLHLQQGRPYQTAALLDTARRATYLGGDETTRHRLYQLLSSFSRRNNDFRSAISYADSANYWRDSLTRRLDKGLKMKAEFAYAESRYRKDVGTLEQRLATNRLLRNGLFILIFLGAVTTYLFYRNRRQRMLLLKAKNEQTSRELKHAQERLGQMMVSIQEKNAIIDNLENLPVPANMDQQQQQEDLLKQLRSSVIITKDGWQEFQEIFEAVFPGHIQMLLQSCPNCTPSEYRMLILEKLELSTKDMAAMLGVSPETIRSTRSRLRKKLDNSEA